MNGEGGVPRLFFSTREACSQAGISAHTLRYWERRLGLTFLRSPRGKRMFRAEDIERLRRVASLLRDGYSLKAVPRQLREHVQMELPLDRAGKENGRVLKRVRDELERIVETLEGGQG